MGGIAEVLTLLSHDWGKGVFLMAHIYHPDKKEIYIMKFLFVHRYFTSTSMLIIIIKKFQNLKEIL